MLPGAAVCKRGDMPCLSDVGHVYLHMLLSLWVLFWPVSIWMLEKLVIHTVYIMPAQNISCATVFTPLLKQAY